MFQACAFLSGIGGGNFACSMSNISGFYPKRLQGTGLGLNAGLGNFGVTTMQVLIPLVMTVGLFGAVGGGSMVLTKDSGWILGKILAGTPTFIQNAGFIWAAILLPLVIAAWFGMNNLLPLSPNYGGTLAAFAKILYLWGITCLIGGLGLYLYLPAPTGLGLLNMWVALPLIIVATLMVMRLAAFGEMKGNIAKQFDIFKNKHTWSLTLLYIVTFGSFHWFLDGLAAVDHRHLWHQPCARRCRDHAAHPEESKRAIRPHLCLDRPVCRRPDSPGGRLDF